MRLRFNRTLLALDMELYAYASRLFDEKIGQVDIRHEMRLLEERRNSSYLRWHDVTTQYVKRKIRKWAPAWL